MDGGSSRGIDLLTRGGMHGALAQLGETRVSRGSPSREPDCRCCCSDCVGLMSAICTGLFRSWIVVVRDQSGKGGCVFLSK